MQYADDTLIFYNHQNIKNAHQDLRLACRKLSNNFTKLYLKQNTEKI